MDLPWLLSLTFVLCTACRGCVGNEASSSSTFQSRPQPDVLHAQQWFLCSLRWRVWRHYFKWFGAIFFLFPCPCNKTLTHDSQSEDSSPQGKLDLMMTLEDRISMSDAAALIACGGDVGKIQDWSLRPKITTTQLPLGIIGSGNAGLAAKHECIFHQATWHFKSSSSGSQQLCLLMFN